MHCKYPERDLPQRLDQTICRYKGKPYFVRTPGGNEITLREVYGDKVYGVIDSSDFDFDISSIPLGFCQFNNAQVCFASRVPSRIWKQGICQDNLLFRDLRGTSLPLSIRSIQFYKMLTDDYPSIDEALKIFYSKSVVDGTEIAISKQVCLKISTKLKRIAVYYGLDQVGFIMNNTKTVIVPSDEFGWVVSEYLRGFDWVID